MLQVLNSGRASDSIMMKVQQAYDAVTRLSPAAAPSAASRFACALCTAYYRRRSSTAIKRYAMDLRGKVDAAMVAAGLEKASAAVFQFIGMTIRFQ